MNNTSEHFEWYPLQFGPNASNCYDLDNKSCLKYSNCGICRSGYNTKCVPGDEMGSFFEGGCDDWVYTSNTDHIFLEKSTSVTPSYDKQYIDYEQWYISPVSRSALQ
jgi:hypothetical protein